MKPPEILSRFAEARALLAGPLKFGDCPHEDYADTSEDCKECSGHCRKRCGECGQLYDCPKCKGTGANVKPCSCFVGIQRDVVREAFRIAGEKLPEWVDA